jgi:hypothetical protein
VSALTALRGVAAALVAVAMLRVGGAVISTWNIYAGELLAAFPGHLVLDRLNPQLYAEAPVPWVPSTWEGARAWFYGPFHHIAYLPLLAVAPSMAALWHSLLLIQIVAVTVLLAAVARTDQEVRDGRRLLFFLLLCGLAFNQFAVLDNLRQRNTELLEFALLLGALWALSRAREMSGGAMMALAGLTKLLPMVFFLLIPARGLKRAFAGYAGAALAVVLLAQLLLGWQNYVLFQPRVATSHGFPTVAAVRGEQPLTEPSDQRGSLYTFVLSPFYDIEFLPGHSSPTVRRAASNFLVPNLLFEGLVLFILGATIVAIRRTGNDWLFAFGLLGCVTLLASPRTNPHYYVFPLFGVFWFARRFLDRAESGRFDRADVALAAALGAVLLAFGSLVPLGVVDRLFGLVPATYFSMLAVYGIQGAATFSLWALLLFVRFAVDGSPASYRLAAAAAGPAT